MKKATDPPPYPPLKNIGFMLGMIARWDKAIFLLGALLIPALVVLPLLSIYLSKVVVEAVTTAADPLDFVLIVLLFSASIFLCNVIINVCDDILRSRSTLIRFRYINLCSEKIMDTDFANIESSEGQDKMKRAIKLMDAMKAQNVIGGRVEGAQQIVSQIAWLFSGMFGIIAYGAIIFSLSPYIILLILASTVAGYLVDKRFTDWLFSTRGIWRPMDHKINYIKYTLDDPRRAKDVILYGIKKWMVDFFNATAKLRTEWHYRIFRRHFASNVAGEFCALIRDALSLGCLVYMMMERSMPISDFVLYFGVIDGFSELLLSFASQAQGIYETALEFCDYREFLDMPDRQNRSGGRKPLPGAPEIVLEDVSFRYSGAEDGKNALSHIGLRIKAGEKIAVVGANGAGKTTLVKLICGLYQPTSGRLLMGGHDVSEYAIQDYYAHFSTVFQDISLVPVSIAKNIAMCSDEKVDRARVELCLRQAELWDKVCTLPEGMDTLLVRGVNEGAMELSGGETQRIALARALYKDGNVLVLDEPTAALDPIAENRLYLKYNELTAGKTSVFISHRLSSTRFCDRIFFMEHGEITECGTHDELMALGGGYAKMFDVQSYYYREHENGEEAAE